MPRLTNRAEGDRRGSPNRSAQHLGGRYLGRRTPGESLELCGLLLEKPKSFENGYSNHSRSGDSRVSVCRVFF